MGHRSIFGKIEKDQLGKMLDTVKKETDYFHAIIILLVARTPKPGGKPATHGGWDCGEQYIDRHGKGSSYFRGDLSRSRTCIEAGGKRGRLTAERSNPVFVTKKKCNK